ncbi:MAG: endopeptidase La [Rickettsiales bacterium]|jgi:ATP-dependent Lon protease|nr:endopeptidase La [Rickettsiales bacterium]
MFSKPRRLIRHIASKEDALPVLPLRDIVVFPGMMVPVVVPKGVPADAIEDAAANDAPILLVACTDGGELGSPEALFGVGVRARIVQSISEGGTEKLLVEADEKMRIKGVEIIRGALIAHAEPLPEDLSYPEPMGEEIAALRRAVLADFYRYVRSGRSMVSGDAAGLENIGNIPLLIATIAMAVPGKMAKKQMLLEEPTIAGKLKGLLSILRDELAQIKIDRQIRNKVIESVNQNQREYYLNEAMRAIQKELGDDEASEMGELDKRIEAKKLPTEAARRAKSELKKLAKMHAQSSEAAVLRGYIETILELPWSEKSELQTDLEKAAAALDKGHYALDKIKERILEFLAVQKRAEKSKGTILCFVGPPGVGKTSLGKVVAEATGRKFAKLSLGGIRDEAEIRGHRRTYVGSTTGKILSTMKKSGVTNPLILLDEIDKMGSDGYHGDPSSAMLEVLDPEQNVAFGDHYLDLDYDLSGVMFIATANGLDGIPRPLMDRMEIIELSGYTEAEKLEIAKRHIVPKSLLKNALGTKEIEIRDDAIKLIISKYTRESGVRGLERQIDRLMRKAVRSLLGGANAPVKIGAKNLKDFLGIEKFDHQEAEKEDAIGTVSGLAWTEVGGEMLTVEAAVMEGKGEARFTGKLGDVMKESIETAKSYIRSRSRQFGIDPKIWSKIDIHIHVPEGATPKDGPSAGIAMMTAIVSAMTEIPVKHDIAMTGEITLRGRVLPIGGLKEKLLAAARAGIKTALIPFENKKDLEEIPDIVKDKLKIVPVKTADEVLKLVLAAPLRPLAETGGFFEGLLSEIRLARPGATTRI